MRNSGKSKFFLLYFLIASITKLYSTEVEFFFHPNEFSIGEVAKLEVKAYGDKPFRTLQTNVKKKWSKSPVCGKWHRNSNHQF